MSKVCNTCGETKAFDAFYKYSGKYTKHCKECVRVKNREHSRKYRKNNPEKVRENKARYHRNKPETSIAYRENNKEKLTKQRRDQRRKKEEHYANNPKEREIYLQDRKKQRTAYRILNREKLVASRLMNRFGLLPEDLERLLADQNNCCKLCDIEFDGSVKRCIDHCHSSTRVRGVLCGHCNTMLGMAKDDPDTLKRAIEYLEKSNA